MSDAARDDRRHGRAARARLPRVALRFAAHFTVRLADLAPRPRRLSDEGPGGEQIPERGGALLVANHVSFVDAVLIAAVAGRPVRFLMFRGFFEVPLLGWFARRMDAIPVSSSDSKEDKEAALGQAVEAARSGELVCIFAEGAITRSGHTMPFRTGLERIARSAHPGAAGRARPPVGQHLLVLGRPCVHEAPRGDSPSRSTSRSASRSPRTWTRSRSASGSRSRSPCCGRSGRGGGDHSRGASCGRRARCAPPRGRVRDRRLLELPQAAGGVPLHARGAAPAPGGGEERGGPAPTRCWRRPREHRSRSRRPRHGQPELHPGERRPRRDVRAGGLRA